MTRMLNGFKEIMAQLLRKVQESMSWSEKLLHFEMKNIVDKIENQKELWISE